jgi:acyl-coenzyme A thioesterase PaaI-like protein
MPISLRHGFDNRLAVDKGKLCANAGVRRSEWRATRSAREGEIEMSVYELIRTQLASTVPFAAHVGVELTEIADGYATARLAQSPTSINHIGSQHAGALFTLGEAASGGAMAGAFASQLLTIRPVAGRAEVQYLRIAKGDINATARLADPADTVRSRLDADGKTAFDVDVVLNDEAGEVVATMKIAWHVKKMG